MKDSAKSSTDNEDNALFVQKLKQYFGHYSQYVPSKTNNVSFSINHVNGKVRYDARNFLDKSKEALSSNIFDCLQRSEDHFIADLFSR